MVAVDREVFTRPVQVLAAFGRPAEMLKLRSRHLQVWLTVNLDEEFISAFVSMRSIPGWHTAQRAGVCIWRTRSAPGTSL